MKMILRVIYVAFCVWMLQCSSYGQAGSYAAYLFAYFTGNTAADESIHFAISNDGYHYMALNQNQPIIASSDISSTGGVRDPHILRGIDGKTFYMVATDMMAAKGWNSNRAMVLLKSKDLIHWTSAVVNIQKRFPGHDSLLRVWAPQTIYDAVAKKYMIYFSMKHGSEPDKIYYAYANDDFTDLESVPEQLLYKPGGGPCIDPDIIQKDGRYFLFFKTEEPGAGIKIAESDQLTSGYKVRDEYVQQTKDPVEGSGAFKLNNEKGYILMYDLYTKGKYQFTHSTDLQHFEVVDQEISMDFHPRHGTVISITAAEAKRLMQTWGNAGDIIRSAQAEAIKKNNIALDTATASLLLPVKPATRLRAFDPKFVQYKGVTITPTGKQNFQKNGIVYTVAINGKPKQQFNVFAKEFHNPVVEGYYADPDVLYAHKTKRYYIYPTSDGFTGWSGNYFKTFSSADLVNWKDEGVILDLEKDVSWATKNAWAPGIVERKEGDDYKYYYYFCAEQKIGVAVADDPAGPFKDSGKPLIDQRPEAVKGGQQIDPAVFKDPVSGTYYLYWGNSYLAVAELNDDMVSIKDGTTRIITLDNTFREGIYVIYRNGVYYFMWSEDDTRSENYKVRWGTSTSALGPVQIPANNILIAKDTANGIYGTGHHSVLQIPGKDEWYIFYHRFTFPKGITMGRAAGYNREVCIDKLFFNEDGSIRRVTPTHTGIEALPVKE